MEPCDIFVGAITNYGVDKIMLLVSSLNQCGFRGEKYMIVYDVTYNTIEYLKRNGFNVWPVGKDDPEHCRYTYEPDAHANFHINVERFLHMWLLLKGLPDPSKYRYVVSTDIGDVVFQSDPSEWLERHLGDAQLNAASESICFEDEVNWGARNMRDSFGDDVFDHMKRRLIFNAGTLSGRFEAVRDLFLSIHLMCQSYGTANPDQAAYNVLLSLQPYQDTTRFTPSFDAWACQMGTTCDPRKDASIGASIVEPRPTMDIESGLVTTQDGRPYVIVHQYNRISSLTAILINKYIMKSPTALRELAAWLLHCVT